MRSKLIIKIHIRGGILGKISPKRKSFEPALAEFANSQRALGMKLPVTNVIGAAKTSHGVYSLIKFVPLCATLLQKLPEMPAAPLAEFVKSFHSKHVYHRDLNSGNILFSPNEVLLADCAGLIFRDRPSPQLERAGFAKLYRHLRKNAGKILTEQFMPEFLLRYYGEPIAADKAMKFCRRSLIFHLT